MPRLMRLWLVLLLMTSAVAPAIAYTWDEVWYYTVEPVWTMYATIVGAQPGWHDGYDGQPLAHPERYTGGVAVLLYRENGPGWTGPRGFYNQDFESPIPAGGSKTWWDMYAWAQGYSPPAGEPNVICGPDVSGVPSSYTGRLVLDYVPESLDYTGPREFSLRMSRGNVLTLPIPTVTDGLRGTRMHLTVYRPIPEPSSLAGLALAGGLALLHLRRKRR